MTVYKPEGKEPDVDSGGRERREVATMGMTDDGGAPGSSDHCSAAVPIEATENT